MFNMAAITLFKTSMLRPSLSRMASTVNSAVFQKFGLSLQRFEVLRPEIDGNLVGCRRRS